MRSFHLLRVSAFALLILTANLHAQLVGGQWETLHQYQGQASEELGHSVSGAGDVDGDGFDDFIVGVPFTNWQAGSASVYSGASGNLIWQFDGLAAGDNFGSSVSDAGDVDGDGFDDVIVGAPNADPGGLSHAGSAFVYSGATGTLIWQFDGQAGGFLLGHSVSVASDIDGDGFPDLIVGAPGSEPFGISNAGSAHVYSGATGNSIWQFNGQAADDYLGNAVSGAGDVDGDGFDDIVVGADGANPGGLPNAGSAYVYSGATGNLVMQFDGQGAHDIFGNSVSGAGDVDGDGFDDVIVGAPRAAPGGISLAGSAYVYSGSTGTLIWQIDGQTWWYLGISVSDAGDVDGDGFGDFIVGAIGADGPLLNHEGSAFVYSGATGNLIRRFDGLAAFDQLGRSVSNAGDVDGDGVDDVIVGARIGGPSGDLLEGAAYVFSLDPFLYMDSSEFSLSGGASVHLGMDFPASEAGARYAVLASLAGTGPTVMFGFEIPLSQDFLFNRIISGNVPSVLQGAFGTLNANSRALATLSSGPSLAPAIGQTIYFAAVTYDVGPLVGRMSSVVRYLSIVP